MKNVWVCIGIMFLVWGCGVNHKVRKQERGEERVRMEVVCRDSTELGELYQRLSGRRILLKRLELGIPDTLGRQYVNVVTEVVIEEDMKEERVTNLSAGSTVRVDRVEERSLEKAGELEVKTGKGLFSWIMVILLVVAGGIGGYLFIRRR